MSRGPASIPLTPSGHDSEYAPLRPSFRDQLQQLWSLPFDQFRTVWASLPPTLPDDVPTLEDDIDARHEDVVVRDGASVDVLIYRPKGVDVDEVLPLFFYMHGGGWALGTHSIDEVTLRCVCARNRCVVVSVEHRKPPEFPFPQPLNDCFDVFQWCRNNASKLSLDPTRIIIGGSSSGGNLASTLTLTLRAQDTLSGVLGQVLNSPVTCHPAYHGEASQRFNINSNSNSNDDKQPLPFTSYDESADTEVITTANMHWFWSMYTPEATTTRSPYASPLLADSHAGLPAALVQIADKDPLRDEGLAYARALESAGVAVTLNRYPGLPHAFYQFAGLTQAERYQDEIVEFVRGVFA